MIAGILFFVVGILYCIPSLVALARFHRNAAAITLLNVLLGWTLIGWISALVWAATNNVKRQPRQRTFANDF